MQCNKLNGKFLKVKAKVSGFLIARVEKRVTPEKTIVVTVKRKKNTILTSGLQDLLNAFQYYMSGVNYVGTNAPAPGIVITTSSGQTITLPFFVAPTPSATNNSAILAFTVRDDSANSYTATSEELITTSAGFNIPIATANLSITKQSDEILTLTWVITITVSPSGNIIYIPTPTPQGGATAGCTNSLSGCGICTESNINSLYPNSYNGCSFYELSAQHTETSFVTSTLFTDMFYNTYSKGPSNSFTYAYGTTLIIYTPYCSVYFFAGFFGGSVNFASADSNGDTECWTGPNSAITTIYIQVYSPTETAPYIGVQIEFTT